ncbi:MULTISPECIES: tyrosine-type recombinase/integrase [Streptomyces]|uniref:tyrosine-type recombinase/integrase n=1 Tax=Streptomyces TaxID=1883 RepID=UPI000FFF57FB|nr:MULTISPECIES: tyrosine-type recombinase/integrase [Streptomyces]
MRTRLAWVFWLRARRACTVVRSAQAEVTRTRRRRSRWSRSPLRAGEREPPLRSTGHAHDLPHTGLTWLADAGVPIHILRKIAGHGPLKTTQRYLHPNTHKITAAGTALTAHLSVLRAPRSPPGPTVLTR